MRLDFGFVVSPPHQQNQTRMSSSLTTLVPVLNGPNYTSWVPMMQSFLMSQGQWKVMDPPLVPVEQSPATVRGAAYNLLALEV